MRWKRRLVAVAGGAAVLLVLAFLVAFLRHSPGGEEVPPLDLDNSPLPIPAGMYASSFYLHPDGGLLFKAWDIRQAPQPPMTIYYWKGTELRRFDPPRKLFFPASWVEWQGSLCVFDYISRKLYPFSASSGGIGRPLPFEGNLAIVLPLSDGSYCTGGRLAISSDQGYYLAIRDPEMRVIREFCPVRTMEDPDEVEWNDSVWAAVDSSGRIWVVKSTSPRIHLYGAAGESLGAMQLEAPGFVPHPSRSTGDTHVDHAAWTPVVHFSLQEKDGYFLLQWRAGQSSLATTFYDLEGNPLWHGEMPGIVWRLDQHLMYLNVTQDPAGKPQEWIRTQAIPVLPSRTK